MSKSSGGRLAFRESWRGEGERGMGEYTGVDSHPFYFFLYSRDMGLNFFFQTFLLSSKSCLKGLLEFFYPVLTLLLISFYFSPFLDLHSSFTFFWTRGKSGNVVLLSLRFRCRFSFSCTSWAYSSSLNLLCLQ